MRLLLALAYPLLAHAASARGRRRAGGVALADLALFVLLRAAAAAARRGPGCCLLRSALGLCALARSPHALLPLLLVPVAFIALVAWMFGRTLRAGRVPLITQDRRGARSACRATQLAPELQRYTRRLTAAWAGLLARWRWSTCCWR